MQARRDAKEAVTAREEGNGNYYAKRLVVAGRWAGGTRVPSRRQTTKSDRLSHILAGVRHLFGFGFVPLKHRKRGSGLSKTVGPAT
jgi:hypothetical protein